MSLFSTVPLTNVKRSTFNLSHENKLSLNFGGLYPVLTHTVLPGDVQSLGIQSFLRTVPLLSPVMHRNDIKLDAFFVPFRLIWNSYEKFFQCEDDTLKMPRWHISAACSETFYNRLLGVGSLADYLNFSSIPFNLFPSASETTRDCKSRFINDLPFRAYNLIYDYYYRNKTLEKSILDSSVSPYYDLKTDSDRGLNAGTPFLGCYQIRYRSWRRDPYTSALPFPQRGTPIEIPHGDIDTSDALKLKDINDPVSEGIVSVTSSGSLTRSDPDTENSNVQRISSGVKLSNNPTLDDFRVAEALEEYEEALARSGSSGLGTFKEWLLSIWRTLSPDARLDRPEYLGGYRGPIQISEVPQTSEGTATSAQGTLAGKGLSVGGNVLFRRVHFKEPGILMVIASVVPKSAYFQGDPREWLYDNCFDFPNPYFANLGEQEVLSAEVNAAQSLLNSDQPRVFGYNVRNYEMKQIPDSVHGHFRSDLLYWHEARKFHDTGTDIGDITTLNENFVKMYPSEVSRIFPSIETSDKLLLQLFMDYRAVRRLPYYGVPRIGHNK